MLSGRHIVGDLLQGGFVGFGIHLSQQQSIHSGKVEMIIPGMPLFCPLKSVANAVLNQRIIGWFPGLHHRIGNETRFSLRDLPCL